MMMSTTQRFDRLVRSIPVMAYLKQQRVEAATAGKLDASLPQGRNLDDEARKRGSQAAAAARRKRARDVYAHLIPTMLELQAAGRSLAQIAENLNDQGHKTRRDKRWSKTQVRRVLDRVRPAWGGGRPTLP